LSTTAGGDGQGRAFEPEAGRQADPRWPLDTAGTTRSTCFIREQSFVAETAQDFAVNLDPRESDPTRLAPEKRPDRIAVASPGAKPPKHRVELWHALSALLIVILLVESLLSVRWRRARAADEG
jgi:hypothetical protein